MKLGIILIVVALIIGFFAQSHRPVEGMMDAFQREGSWVLKPGAYYVFLFIAAMFGLFGVLRLVKANKK